MSNAARNATIGGFVVCGVVIIALIIVVSILASRSCPKKATDFVAGVDRNGNVGVDEEVFTINVPNDSQNHPIGSVRDFTNFIDTAIKGIVSSSYSWRVANRKQFERYYVKQGGQLPVDSVVYMTDENSLVSVHYSPQRFSHASRVITDPSYGVVYTHADLSELSTDNYITVAIHGIKPTQGSAVPGVKPFTPRRWSLYSELLSAEQSQKFASISLSQNIVKTRPTSFGSAKDENKSVLDRVSK